MGAEERIQHRWRECLHVTCVRSVMVYGSETWTMNVEKSARLEAWSRQG